MRLDHLLSKEKNLHTILIIYSNFLYLKAFNSLDFNDSYKGVVIIKKIACLVIAVSMLFSNVLAFENITKYDNKIEASD